MFGDDWDWDFDSDWGSGLDVPDLAYTVSAVGLAYVLGLFVDFMIKAFIDFVIYAMGLMYNAVVSVIGYVPSTPPALLLIATSIVPAMITAFLSTLTLIAAIRHKIDEAEHLLLAFFVITLIAFTIINTML